MPGVSGSDFFDSLEQTGLPPVSLGRNGADVFERVNRENADTTIDRIFSEADSAPSDYGVARIAGAERGEHNHR